MRRNTRIRSFVLSLALLLGLTVPAGAAQADPALATALDDTAAYVCRTVNAPGIASVGGDWAVLGLARGGCDVPEGYFGAYYAQVEATVKTCGGVLHARKYTEYSRVILALSAIGKDARDVAGYDLTKPLGDYEKTIWQGMNGPVWALLALDSRDYPMPQNPDAAVQATRQMYLEHILACQLPSGGWSLTGRAGDALDFDLTAMALQALAKYQTRSAVAAATARALAYLSALQGSDGGFATGCESNVQVITALCELGLPLTDPRFVKHGNTLLDGLLTCYRPGAGFSHLAGDGVSNPMAGEQGLYALAALHRNALGESSLYRMSGAADAVGLPGKDPAVRQVPVTAPNVVFTDILGHKNQTEITALASRGILNGVGSGRFAPDAPLTRAAFAILIVRALGLTPEKSGAFTDVGGTVWYAPYVDMAARLGIVSGVSGGKFNPTGAITRQQAMAMTARAAKLCGMETSLSNGAVQSVLSSYADGKAVGDWAKPSVAFCAGFLPASETTLRPGDAIRRCEAAEMVYNLLKIAKLL